MGLAPPLGAHIRNPMGNLTYRRLNMTTKVLVDRRKLFVNTIKGISETPVNRSIEKVTASAVFRRHKPKPCLTPTGFDLTFSYRDDETYESSTRIGENSFVFGNSGKIRQFSSDDGSLALLRARAKSAGSEFNFGETLVEFGETVGLLNSALDRLYRSMSALSKGKFGKALSIMGDSSRSQKALRSLPVSKRISQGYLELSFGWLPMISDVHNATVAYTQGLLSAGDRISKRSGSTQNGGMDLSNNTWAPEASASVSGVVRSNAVIGANLNNLGLANPLLMAWNKLPFSFLLDWFVPVSTILGALTAGAGLTCYSQTITTVSGSDLLNRQGDPFKRSFIGRRRVSSGLPLLSLQKGPAFSLGQAFTTLALLRSLH